MAWWVLSTASALVMAGLAVFLWVRRPPAPLWPVVFHCQIYALLWVVGDLWASHAVTPTGKQVSLAILFSGSIPIAAAWWLTVCRYAAFHGLGRAWMRSRWIYAPSFFAAAMWLLMITDPLHGQFITGVLKGRNEYHWGVALAFYGNYAIGLATIGLCAWAAWRHANPDVRRKMLILAVASLAPIVANAVHVWLPSQSADDPVAIGLGLASAAIIYGVYRKRLFNPLPVALPELLRRDPTGHMVLDRGGRLLMWNPAAERLLPSVDLEPDMRLLRTLAWQLEDTDNGERLRSSRTLTDLLTADLGTSARHVFRYRGGGQPRWIELSLLPIPSRRGQIAAVCLRLEDVTAYEEAERERRALAGQMREMERLRSLGLMAGGVAHDFNNLLTAIGGNARLAVGEVPADSPTCSHLEEVLDATALAANLTQQLLAYAGRGGFQSEPVDLSDLVADMSRLIESSLPTRITLHPDLGPNLPAVEADPTQLRQVLMNLATNAAEAIGDHPGSLTIRTCAARLDAARIHREGLDERLEPGDYVMLEVADSGCGMDEETQRSIFDPFFTTKRSGRGLGLASVFGIVRAHRGGISIESEAGRGTTFRLWLPSAGTAVFDSRAAPDTDADPHWRGSGVALVVDDEARLRRLARIVLERVGFDVLSAETASKAVDLFRTHREQIRFVLLDLTTRDGGGEEVIEEIRAIDPDARVLLTSGFAERDAMRRLSREKLGGFLPKPWQPGDLLAAVRRLLE